MSEELSVTTTENWKPKHGPWLIALPTIFAAFMFVLDETIANVAVQIKIVKIGRYESDRRGFCNVFERTELYFDEIILIIITCSDKRNRDLAVKLIVYVRDLAVKQSAL